MESAAGVMATVDEMLMLGSATEAAVIVTVGAAVFPGGAWYVAVPLCVGFVNQP